jgi:predicted nucleic acid-binding protein
MAAKAFVDTNIVLRAILDELPQHRETEALIQSLWERDVELWISRQVIREYLVQATHPKTLTVPLTIEQVKRQVEMLTHLFRITDETPIVTQHLLDLLQNYPTRGKQIHDANIVASMLAYEIDTLVTLNLADFTRYSDRIQLITVPSAS